MKYQSRQHVIEAAQAAGSSAQTFRGAARYLIAQVANVTPLHRRGEWVHPWSRKVPGYRSWHTCAVMTPRDRWEPLRRVERMQAKAEAMCAALGLWPLDTTLEHLADVESRARIVVPLGAKHAVELDKTVHAMHPRRQNWLRPAAVADNRPPCCIDLDMGRYSSRCTYTHWQYRPTVGSYAVIIAGNTHTLYVCAGKKASLKAPRGYRWDRDANGLRIVSLTDRRKDYHPDSDDLRSYDARALAKKATDLFARRQAEARQAREELRLDKLSADERTKLIAKAEREGCMVCLADSLRAGNCRAGTEAFAQRHNLDPRRHYKPTQLLRIANGQADRVKLAVAVALRRHRHEMTVGYALLDEHRA